MKRVMATLTGTPDIEEPLTEAEAALLEEEQALWLAEQDPWQNVRVLRKPLIDEAVIVLQRFFSQANFGIAPDITGQQATEWAVYLQALRDVTSDFNTPEDVVWPIKPVS